MVNGVMIRRWLRTRSKTFSSLDLMGMKASGRGGQKIQFNEIAPILPWFIPFKIHLSKSGFFSNPYFMDFSNQKSILIKRILKIGKSKFPIQIFFLSLWYPSFCFIPLFAATLITVVTSSTAPLQFVWSPSSPLQFVWSPSAPLQFILSPSSCSITSSLARFVLLEHLFGCTL